MKSARLFGLFVVLAMAVGCSPARLKVPEEVRATPELPVVGYSQMAMNFKQKDLKIGSYDITNIDRDWDKGSSVGVGPWERDAQKKAFRFDVKAQGRVVHAECMERATQNTVGAWSTAKVTFSCQCNEGDQQRLSLELVNGEGSAQVSEGPFALRPLYQSEQGARLHTPLGYEFRGKTTGAIDVSGPGRAWLPSSVASEDDQLGLVCGYAGFLLYKPTTGFSH